MELDRTGGGLRVVDGRKKTVEIDTRGWERSDAPSVNAALAASPLGPESVETTVSGTVEELGLPSVFVSGVEVGRERHWEFGDTTGTRTLPAAPHLLSVASAVGLFVRFDGPARLVEGDRLAVRFEESTPVSIGFYSRENTPDASIAVPETPTGVASALSLAAATTTDTSPDRTWPTRRHHPPSVETGDTERLPATLRDRRPDMGVELLLPSDLRYLFTAAPLAYYLGAEVCTVPDASPRLVFDGGEEPLGTLPAFQRRTASVLRRVFWLDCVARGAGPHGGDLAVADTFDTLGLDAARLYEAPLAERLRTYLDVPFDSVADRFPEWHLGMYVEPTYDHVETLPHLLANLPHVFLPSAEPMDKPEFLQRTMADGFSEPTQGTTHTAAARGDEPTTSDESTMNDSDSDTNDDTTYRVRREVSSVDLVDPELGPARNHGWLADGVPIDVFKSFPAAYENRDRYHGEGETPMSVVAVVVDRETPMLAAPDGDDAAMRDEHDAAVAHYRERAPKLNAEVEIAENVTTAELARIFEAGHDLVHYIGHRDDDGLECADGALSTESLAESNARTFFLNACGSYPEGEQLIQKGSVAGGVTFEKVGDEEAAQVGTAFARMMMHGFSMERAVKKARKQLTTPKDYAVVGDGTYVLTQSDALVPPDVWVSENQVSTYEIYVRQQGTHSIGTQVLGTFDNIYHINGEGRRYEVEKGDLRILLQGLESPAVFNNRLRWPSNIIEDL